MNPIDADAATRLFGDFIAVDRADLTVRSGEVVGLLGANGAGKTTLIKMILGVLAPTSGRIRLWGEPHSRRLRSRIGYVPQNLGLYTDLTASENLEFRAEVFDVDPDDPEGIGPGLVRSLPLGVQRRAAFFAATQHHPDLLVLDEPTSGVSALARSDLWDLIHRRASEGVGVLVSTHYMDEAEQTDRLVIMSRGEVVTQGSAATVTAGRTVVQVRSDRWSEAFHALDRPGRRIALDGRFVRVMAETPGTVESELAAAGITGEVSTVPATLHETLVELDG
jgi:ABC-2 type transport system ATP-binding protein